MSTSNSIHPTHPQGIRVVDPIEASAWDDLLAPHTSTQFFQTAAWARVLHHTYRQRPFYLVHESESAWDAALPLMEVDSRWTGRRGVCLPFTDGCGPLERRKGASAPLFVRALELGTERRWKYLELRSSTDSWVGTTPSLAFYVHTIPLCERESELLARLDSAVRRGVRKAERSGLEVRWESSLEAVQTFYRLHCGTRRRHGVPPQPFRFFANIQRHVLAPGHGFVVTAYHESCPIAASVFFHHGREAIYKFGASDARFQPLRPNNLVMWAAVRRYAQQGFAGLHLGRTSLANEGLRRFKLGFGAEESQCTYRRYDFRSRSFVQDVDRAEGWMNHLFRRAPERILRWAGEILYPHLS